MDRPPREIRRKEEPRTLRRPLWANDLASPGEGPRKIVKAQELSAILRRAQPAMPAEARDLLTQLEVQQPYEPYPSVRSHLQFPRQAEHLLNHIGAPDPGGISLDHQHAYEQRCADIQRLWQLVHPESYTLLEKYQLTLRPMGRLEIPLGSEHISLQKPSLYYPALLSKIDGQSVLLVDTMCSPAEIIYACMHQLREVERLGGKAEVEGLYSTIPMHVRYERMLHVIEVNHILGKHGLPERYFPLQGIYQEAYHEALRDAYAQGTINKQSSDNMLKTIGQQAARKVLWELVRERSPEKAVYLPSSPEKVPDELRAAEQWNIAPLRMGPTFIKAVKEWAEHQHLGKAISEPHLQNWIWALTKKKDLLLLPRWGFSLSENEETVLVREMVHVMVSQGMPVIAAGELDLLVRFPSGPEERLHIAGKELNNQTGHFRVSPESFHAHLILVLRDLWHNEIDTSEMNIVAKF